jgi:hypothetical protein
MRFLTLGAVLGASAAAAVPITSALAGGRAAKKPFRAHISYVETDHGHQQGSATVGIVGHGSFSAKLGAHAAVAEALLSLATGVPVSKVARGGTYTVQRRISSTGVGSGLAVAKFKAHGLGTLCLSFGFVPGKYTPGSSFVPVSGTLKPDGGTGSAAHWRGSLSFKQTTIGGSNTETIGVSGTLRASTAGARHMSAACRSVAKLH